MPEVYVLNDFKIYFMSNRITHIRKPNVNSTHEHITHVKVVTDPPGSTIHELTVPDVIKYLKSTNPVYEFYVLVGTSRITVTHQKSSNGNEYIKTRPDHTTKDNLLSLPQF